MIKKIAWNTFKNTGNIDAFLEFKEIENIQNEIEKSIKDDSTKLNEKDKKWQV